MLPLAFMFILTLYSVVDTGETYSGTSENFSDLDSITINGTDTGTVDIPGSEPQTFDIWVIKGVIIILIACIALGIIGGIRILGSGISETSVHMLFTGTLFLGLWACLTVLVSSYMYDQQLTFFLWIGLTAMFTIGVAKEIIGTSD